MSHYYCPARLHHGPGHQSTSYCEKTGPHDIHQVSYLGEDRGGGIAKWRGPEATSGFFDQPPPFDENDAVYCVYKYNFFIDEEFAISMPAGGRILHVEVQHNQPCMWVLVNPVAPKTVRQFRIYGTGHKIYRSLPHVATFFTDGGNFVWHLFEETD